MSAIGNLLAVPLEDIHAAFTDAFSTYEVKIPMPIERLAEMMRTRSYAPDLSLGCFDDGRLTGFLLAGLREPDGVRTCYDLATGVVQGSQKAGVGDRLLEAMLGQLRERGVGRFVLEVLVTNEPARRLYEKHGFRITRRLNCYERALDRSSGSGEKAVAKKAALQAPEQGRLDLANPRFQLFAPSWQNSIESFRAGFEYYEVAWARVGDRLAGFAIVHRTSGSILQIGLDRPFRDREGMAASIGAAAGATRADKLVYLNVEAGCPLEPLLEESGFSRTVDQYEMEYRPTKEE